MFICTHDMELVDKLRANNYPLFKIREINDRVIYVFKNINTINFTEEENKKIVITNKIFL